MTIRLVGPATAAPEDAATKKYVDDQLAGFDAGPAGGLIPTTVTTTSHAATAGELVLCDPSAAAFVVTLPAGAAAGDVVGVKRVDDGGNPVIVQPAAGSSIDGDTELRLAGPRTAARLVADTDGGWRIEATAVFDPPAGAVPTASRQVLVTGLTLGLLPGGQTDYQWFELHAVCERGLASLIEVTADGPGRFDLRVTGVDDTLWLEAVGVTAGTYRNPMPWYLQTDQPGNDSVLIGVRNTGADPRTFTLTALRIERFA